jgi:glucose-fructose oxidoreductase
MNGLTVNAANGWYKLEPFSAYSNVQGETSDGTKIPPAITRIPQEQIQQMDDDAMHIMSKIPVMVPGEEGLKDIRVVEAIYRSVKEKGRVKI